MEKAEEVKKCVDDPNFANCDLIVRANYCTKNAYYADFCWASCTQAGLLDEDHVFTDEVTQQEEPENEETEETEAEMPVEESTDEEYEAEYETTDGT